jgi:hypothetical protein
MRVLSDAERTAWKRLAAAELAVHEAHLEIMRVTSLAHARRSGRLRLVPRETHQAAPARSGESRGHLDERP